MRWNEHGYNGKTGDHNPIGIKKEQKKMELERDQEEFQQEGEKRKMKDVIFKIHNHVWTSWERDMHEL